LKDQWDEIWTRQKTAENKLQKSNEEKQQLDEELEVGGIFNLAKDLKMVELYLEKRQM